MPAVETDYSYSTLALRKRSVGCRPQPGRGPPSRIRSSGDLFATGRTGVMHRHGLHRARMDPQRHLPPLRPRPIASALLIWLAALLSVAAGIQPAAPPDLARTIQASSAAARSGDLPIQRSKAANLQPRVAVLTARGGAVLPAFGNDGSNAALLPYFAVDLPPYRAAIGRQAPPAALRTAPAAGFRARAPPILA